MRLEQHKVLHIKLAHRARVNTVRRMATASVHRRCGRVREGHRTQTASVRPGARVNGHMVAQPLRGEEAARTEFTNVNSILLVSANVFVEDKLSREAAATNVTGELIVFDVGRHVLTQETAFEEGRGAEFAFERSANIKQTDRECQIVSSIQQKKKHTHKMV